MNTTQKISSEAFKDIDLSVSDLRDKFCDLLEVFENHGIEYKDISWIKELGIIREIGKAVDDWKENCIEICEDEEVEFKVTKENGINVYVKGKVNFASEKVICDSEEFFQDDISKISFEYESEIFEVCLECGEYILQGDKCKSCHG
jgi:hypothetical protein